MRRVNLDRLIADWWLKIVRICRCPPLALEQVGTQQELKRCPQSCCHHTIVIHVELLEDGLVQLPPQRWRGVEVRLVAVDSETQATLKGPLQLLLACVSHSGLPLQSQHAGCQPFLLRLEEIEWNGVGVEGLHELLALGFQQLELALGHPLRVAGCLAVVLEILQQDGLEQCCVARLKSHVPPFLLDVSLDQVGGDVGRVAVWLAGSTPRVTGSRRDCAQTRLSPKTSGQRVASRDVGSDGRPANEVKRVGQVHERRWTVLGRLTVAAASLLLITACSNSTGGTSAPTAASSTSSPTLETAPQLTVPAQARVVPESVGLGGSFTVAPAGPVERICGGVRVYRVTADGGVEAIGLLGRDGSQWQSSVGGATTTICGAAVSPITDEAALQLPPTLAAGQYVICLTPNYDPAGCGVLTVTPTTAG